MSEQDEDTVCDHVGTELLVFGERQVQRGRCLAHSNRGCVIYSGTDLHTGDMLAIAEWKINIKDHDNVSHHLKHINSCEQAFTHLSKLRHPNLVRYLNMKHVQKEEEIVIYVLQEFVFGINCNALFNKENIPVDMHRLRHIACGVLTALEFLHDNNILQREFRNSSIFIDNNGTVKVSSYSVDVKCWELTHQAPSAKSSTNKTDIYKFGLFIMSLLKGFIVDISEVEISPTLPEDLFDFLSKCLIKGEQRHYSAAELLQHPFICTPMQHTCPITVFEENVLPQEVFPSLHENNRLHTQTSGSSSRILQEFEEIEWLGRGGFGDVLKVRNKLDGRCYAIKKIKLHRKNEKLNQKIRQEVKLLSRLYHDNVVRYYNSWIENALLDSDENACMDPSQSMDDSFSECDDEAWKLTLWDDESSCSEDLSKPGDTDSSECVVFESGSSTDAQHSECLCDSDDPPTQPDSSQSMPETQFMYIQMEFCERSTLRNAIDSGLHSDEKRMWRLFREIVEGLAHIHRQGVIHRDLKPVNIFLTSSDQVKIGDFGLATTNILSQQVLDLFNASTSDRGIFHDGSRIMTGHVGTALYVAPEVTAALETKYDMKVDIYSLGIILFEMCYNGMTTESERIQVLSNIRQKEIVYPEEFLNVKYTNQRKVVSMLLNHKAQQRPAADVILRSKHVPRPESELNDLVRNPQSKAYLVQSCFRQKLNAAEDHDRSRPAKFTQPLALYRYVKQIVSKVFNIHGGQNLSTQLMGTKTNIYNNDTSVQLMTTRGKIISISHDLRIPFAHYVAGKGITQLKRYCIDRVFREEQGKYGVNVRELYECAFDIVTPNPGSFMADAELLSIVNDILKKLPDLSKKQFVVRINHLVLLKAILLSCKIPNEKHQDVYSILANRTDLNDENIVKSLGNLGLERDVVHYLLNLIKFEMKLFNIKSLIEIITQSNIEARQLATEALGELTKLVRNTRALGVKFELVIYLGLVHNMEQYNGLMYQFLCKLKKPRHYCDVEVIAAGGRYDSMLANLRSCMERPGHMSRVTSQSGAGITLSLDKLVQALQEIRLEIKPSCNLDAVVCTTEWRPMMKEKANVLRKLWSAGIRCSLLEAQNLTGIQKECTKMLVPHIVIITSVPGEVKVQSWQNDRYLEEKKNIKTELVSYLLQLIKSSNKQTSGTIARKEPSFKRKSPVKTVISFTLNSN